MSKNKQNYSWVREEPPPHCHNHSESEPTEGLVTKGKCLWTDQSVVVDNCIL